MVFLIGGVLKAVATVPPIGLIHVGWVSSNIKDWLDNNAMSTCQDGCSVDHREGFHDTRARPFVETNMDMRELNIVITNHYVYFTCFPYQDTWCTNRHVIISVSSVSFITSS